MFNYCSAPEARKAHLTNLSFVQHSRLIVIIRLSLARVPVHLVIPDAGCLLPKRHQVDYKSAAMTSMAYSPFTRISRSKSKADLYKSLNMVEGNEAHDRLYKLMMVPTFQTNGLLPVVLTAP